MSFWLPAMALVLSAAAFVAWPLLRRARRPGPEDPLADPDAMVRALYQDRVDELAQESGSGRLDEDTRAEVEAELGANLLAEYRNDGRPAARQADPAGDGSTPGSTPAPGLGPWLLAALLPVFGVVVYLSVGEPTAGAVAGATAVLRLDPAVDGAELEQWRERLERRVAAEPEDRQSWYLLGITRLQLDDFAAAAEALSRAQSQDEPDAHVDLYWLQARYLAAGGQLDSLSRGIADRLLARQPNQPMVLEMLALQAYREEDYRSAVGYLNRALMNDLDESRAAALLAGLTQARSRLGELRPSVEVDISAADGAPQDATLFVIARPPGGGMPYAVVRRPAALLPLSVQLDDTVSMNPALQLSQAGPVEVVVRLSRSGAPAAGPGDWEWRSDTLALAETDAPVRLVVHLLPPAAPEHPVHPPRKGGPQGT